MLPVDYLHVLCLVGLLLYVWRREPARLLLTPLMLLSFFVLYGAGNIIYFQGADTLPDIHRAVTLSMVLMWLGIIAGIELARASMPVLAARSQHVVRTWNSTTLINRATTDQLLVMLGLLTALFLLAVLIALGKPRQILTFLTLQSVSEKKQYRMELGGQGFYLYQILVVSVAPFLSILLLIKGRVSRQRDLFGVGLLLCLTILACKVGSFQKIPWVIYLLQLMVAFQVCKRLEISVGRAVLYLVVVLGGVIGATLIAIPDLGTDVFEWLGYRFFEVNNEAIYQTFYVYPRYLPHTWGMNIGLIHSVFGNDQLVSAYTEVANFFGAEGATFDTFFVGDAWVDFGYAGVLLMAVLVGYVVKSVDIYIMSFGKTPLAVALLAGGMYGLFQLQVTSAFTAFLSGGLVFIPLLVLASQGLMNDVTRGRLLQWQR
ncbi:MAG TPA: hypothetical protein VKB20_04175 [Steroidobacteraceae bacterium]|nr:hypothetical protein [Steroidobacteraceae bacterium]